MRALAYVLLLSLVPAAATAQSHRDVISGQLDAAASIAADAGYRVSSGVIPQDMIFGLLPPDGAVWLQVDLRAGTNYVIAGACDYDCSDMDLALQHDATTVAEDVELDDVPVIEFRATASGPHLVRVSVPGCDASGCYFGVRVFNN